MRTLFIPLFILFGINLCSAQQFSYGLKAGTNFTSGGQIRGNSHIDEETNEYLYWTGSSQGETKTGFHGGGFLEVAFGNFFLRPELVYTSIKSEFVFPFKSSVYSIEKLDLPFLVGYNFKRVGGLYAGPVYSPMIENKLEHKESTLIKYQDYTNYIPGQSLSNPSVPLNIQLGLKTEFNQLGIDLRYEYSLADSEPEKIDMLNQEVGIQKGGINVVTVEDAGLSQIILSLTYKFNGAEDTRGRRAGYSYSRRRKAR